MNKLWMYLFKNKDEKQNVVILGAISITIVVFAFLLSVLCFPILFIMTKDGKLVFGIIDIILSLATLIACVLIIKLRCYVMDERGNDSLQYKVLYFWILPIFIFFFFFSTILGIQNLFYQN